MTPEVRKLCVTLTLIFCATMVVVALIKSGVIVVLAQWAVIGLIVILLYAMF